MFLNRKNETDEEKIRKKIPAPSTLRFPRKRQRIRVLNRKLHRWNARKFISVRIRTTITAGQLLRPAVPVSKARYIIYPYYFYMEEFIFQIFHNFITQFFIIFSRFNDRRFRDPSKNHVMSRADIWIIELGRIWFESLQRDIRHYWRGLEQLIEKRWKSDLQRSKLEWLSGPAAKAIENNPEG